ncbi:MAG: hypothetical protein WCK77_24495 [Verrucomicrobiota bacterium]
MRSADKEAARDIAVEVVKAYKEDRDEVDARETDGVLEGLREAVRSQEAEVEARRQELADLIRSRGVRVGDGKAPDGAKPGTEQPAGQPAGQKGLEEMESEVISESPGGDEDVVLPYESVIVHDDPVIPRSPDPPKAVPNLIVGATLGLLLVLPLALLVVWLMERLLPRKAVR